MVQRKAPNRLGSQTEFRKEHATKTKSHAASHQQQMTGSNIGGDLKKMKSYMKPTSSSDARKEHPLVSILHPTSSKKRSLGGNSNNLNCSKPSSSSSGSGTKAAKILTRKSSFKLVLPSMKKSSGVALHPNKLVNRATCSSTQKVLEFPKALDLNPGGTEAEGTSVMRVCPYNYCSLNGHLHPPLPPLKPFLKARRSSLKSQKSMKLKGVSPFRKKGQEKAAVEVDTGQVVTNRDSSSLDINPLMAGEEDDFFVEIYAKPQTLILDSETCKQESDRGDEDNLEVIKELSVNKFDQQFPGDEVEDDHNTDLSRMDGSYSIGTSDHSSDRESDLSIEELDVMTIFLEYVDCDQEVKEDGKEQQSCQVHADYTGWIFECCDLVDDSNKDGEGLAEVEENSSICEPNGVDWDEIGQYPDSRIDCSEFLDDGFGPPDCPFLGDEYSFKPDGTLITCQIAGDDLGSREVAERDITSYDDTVSGNNDDDDNAVDVLNSTPLETELLSEDHFQKDAYEEQESNSLHSETIQKDDNEEEESKDEVIAEDTSLCNIEQSDSPQGFNEKEMGTRHDDHIRIESAEACIHDVIQDPEMTHNYSADQSDECNKGQKGDDFENEKPEGIITEPIAQDCIEEDHIMPIRDDLQSVSEVDCVADILENQEENEVRKSAAEDSDPVPEVDGKLRLRLNIVRRKRTEATDENREFNPRPPQFLPLEPDPEAEKVDLRHQLMDERKNAEEWMIDHALQQAVTRLAPARKKKVALLVEAFETVIPLPLYERPLQHSTRGFPHGRPIQACS